MEEGNQAMALAWLQRHQITPKSQRCVCGAEMQTRLRRGRQAPSFRCPRRQCRKEVSQRGNYFKLYKDLPQILRIVYMLMHDYPIRLIRHELGVRRGQAIDEQVECLGQLAALYLNDLFVRSKRTWGLGSMEIQIDEVAFGQSKKIRGHRGRRIRKNGIQWFMSVVHYDTATRKVKGYFLEKIPTNQRTGPRPTRIPRERTGGSRPWPQRSPRQ